MNTGGIYRYLIHLKSIYLGQTFIYILFYFFRFLSVPRAISKVGRETERARERDKKRGKIYERGKKRRPSVCQTEARACDRVSLCIPVGSTRWTTQLYQHQIHDIPVRSHRLLYLSFFFSLSIPRPFLADPITTIYSPQCPSNIAPE